MRIAICDDMPEELEKIRSAAELYGKKRCIRFEINTYGSANDFLADIEKDGDFGAALLDVCMPDISGIEAARKIRSLNKKINIIFLTTSRDYAVEAFSLSAAHYLVKPFSEEQFDEAMDRIFGGSNEKNCITVRCDDELRALELNDVEFFEIRGHDMHIFMMGGEHICIRQTMCSVRGQIGENALFADCGASYIVNLGHIKKMTASVLTMQCGERIPVPRRAYAQLEKRYLDYYRREVTGI